MNEGYFRKEIADARERAVTAELHAQRLAASLTKVLAYIPSELVAASPPLKEAVREAQVVNGIYDRDPSVRKHV